jgi:hypothetical protein
LTRTFAGDYVLESMTGRSRRVLVPVVLFFALLAPAGAQAADPVIERLKAAAAFASFQRCEGTLCTLSLVLFQSLTFTADGTAFSTTKLQQLNQFIVDTTTGEVVRQTFVQGDPDATLRIAGHLRRAEASASFSLTTCDGVPPTNCRTARPRSSSLSSGQAMSRGVPNRLIQTFEGLKIIFTGSFDSRTATGALDGADLGPPLAAGISRSRTGSITVCRLGSPSC